jgi:hypothetical protein
MKSLLSGLFQFFGVRVNISQTEISQSKNLTTLASLFFRINTIREICVRAPLVMNETLLADLVQYRFKKDKSVVMAARSLITLFRIINPTLLPKKERVHLTHIWFSLSLSLSLSRILKINDFETVGKRYWSVCKTESIWWRRDQDNYRWYRTLRKISRVWQWTQWRS